MYKAFLLFTAVAFYAHVCVIGKEGRANDVVITQPDISDFISVHTDEVKGLHVNGSGREMARTDDCINGKWMRKCDIEKTRPCVDKTQVCVCDPEFAETKPGVCKYCDCGQGFNCTYVYERLKKCICPAGYYYNVSTEKCQIECSEKQPCKNGGTCFNKECNCPDGIGGKLCEEILDCSICINAFEADCLFDEHARTSYCSCKNSSLYYDYERDICIPCPCGYGVCVNEISTHSRKLKCDCYSGYKEFLGYCKDCYCGLDGSCELDLNGNKICHCREGYYEREGRCNRCQCGAGWNGTCEVTGNEKVCFCRPGYQFVLGHCEDINECETNDTCPPMTKCYNTPGSFDCQCLDGYVKELIYDAPGDAEAVSTLDFGFVCEDINECRERLDKCSNERFTKCVNVPGSYKCECMPGYEPYSYIVQPHLTLCIETRKSWGPALIVIFTTCALLGVSYFMHVFLRKRAARLN